METDKIKKIFSWQVLFGLALISISIIIYLIHYSIFHDAHHIFIYMIHDLAFMPIEVLFVSLIIHKMLNSREHKIKLKKLNMVIGAFFSEVGTDLIEYIAAFDPFRNDIQNKVIINDTWTEKEFTKTNFYLRLHQYEIEIDKENILPLRTLLTDKRSFLLDLLGNPNLLEHDDFTDLLWAVFHLTEELVHRKKFNICTTEDLDHIRGDIKRVYCLLVKGWLAYMKHLKKDYPYLYSLAVRTNPFDPNAKVEFG
jgi:hypothetical protein